MQHFETPRSWQRSTKTPCSRLGCHAAAAAAITVQRPGADPPTRQELARASRAAAVKRRVDDRLDCRPASKRVSKNESQLR